MNNKINIGLCGIGGYVGYELAQLLVGHPSYQLIAVNARQAPGECSSGRLVGEQLVPTIPFAAVKQGGETELDVLALATPTEISMELVAALQPTAIKVIDLSGAFRLPEQQFSQWYGLSHQVPQQLQHARYGLSPWSAVEPQDQHMVANPGCYATCALMALLPVLTAGIIDGHSIIIDAKSGVSGAGKKANLDLMFCEMMSNFFPYKVGRHQHTPEIENALTQFSGQACRIRLTTHMLPLTRGISMTIYADCQPHFSSDEEITNSVEQALQQAYHNYPLVKYAAINQGQAQQDKFILSLKSVVATPNTHIGYFVDDGKLMLFSCIDNLLKGAASQAVENINAWYRLPLHSGLLAEEVMQ